MFQDQASQNPATLPPETVQPILPEIGEADTLPKSNVTVLELLRMCIETGDGDACASLFLLVEKTAAPAARRLLRRFGFGEMETEGVVLELFENLYLDGFRKLRSCLANNEATLRSWLRVTAVRFTLNWLDRRLRVVRRERAALAEIAPSDRSGPDEGATRAIVDEWRPLMKPRDFGRLLALIGLGAHEPPISVRTRQRWAEQLLRKYPDVFRDAR